MDEPFRVCLVNARVAEQERFRRPLRGTPHASSPPGRSSPASLTGASAQGGAAGEGGGRKEEGGFGQSEAQRAPLPAPPLRRAAFPGAATAPRAAPEPQLFPERPPRPQRGRARDAGAGLRDLRGMGTKRTRAWRESGWARGWKGMHAAGDGARGGKRPEGTRLRPEARRTHRAAPAGRALALSAPEGACADRESAGCAASAASGAAPRSRARGAGAAAPQHPRPPARAVPSAPSRSSRPAPRRLWPRRRKWRLGVPPPARAPPHNAARRRDVTGPAAAGGQRGEAPVDGGLPSRRGRIAAGARAGPASRARPLPLSQLGNNVRCVPSPAFTRPVPL